jgi:saccharopine dehydrogenase-like NADP-dependent oxidoreductase
MARILVLGGAGEMGSVAVDDLRSRTDHEVVVGDVRVDAAERLGVPAIAVDVEDPGALRAAMAGFDLVLNATYMRHNVGVTRAAIDAGIHLVDLGSYYPETLQQLELGEEAERAGCRIVPGCGVAPGLSNVLARHGADRLDSVESISVYSYITHPLWTSPGIVVTRLDASVGISVVYQDGALVERPSLADEEVVAFPEPYGEQRVHLAPHPEAVTLPRYLDVRNVVFKVGYLPEQDLLVRALLELGFDRDEPFELEGQAVSPRAFTAAYVGSRGVPPGDRSANVKQVCVDGVRDGRDIRLIYDFAVEYEGASASSRVTGRVAAVAADLVAAGGLLGVHPPEGGLDADAVLAALAERGLEVRERVLAR